MMLLSSHRHATEERDAFGIVLFEPSLGRGHAAERPEMVLVANLFARIPTQSHPAVEGHQCSFAARFK